MKLLLVLPSFILTLLLAYHAVKKKGSKTALLFFTSAFLFGVVRGNSVALLAGGAEKNPYVFSEAVLRLGRAELAACVGWIFAVYLSWILAEEISKRIPALRDRVFPLAGFAMVAMGCFSYAVETTASGVGWWRWNIVRRANPFLVGGTHLFGIVEWMSVVFDFLLPFLLFRTARGGRWGPAWASLILYPIHWATHWQQETAAGYPHAYEIYHALVALSVLVFPLIRSPRLVPERLREVSEGIENIPSLAVMGMFGVLTVADLAVLKDPELLVSLLPLAVFLTAARWSRRAGLVTLACLAASIVGSLFTVGAGWHLLARACPILVPMAYLFLYGEVPVATRIGLRRVYLVVILLLVLGTAVGLTRSKRERERYSQLVDEGWNLVQEGNLSQGESLLREAMEVKPNVNLAPKLLTRLYGGQGRLEEAWQAVSRSLELDPTDWESYQLGGNVLRSQDRCPEAVPLYERGLMLNPTDAEAAKGLAECLFRAQRFADGIQALRRASSRNPENLEIYYLLGGALLQTHDYREAHRVVTRALRVAPEDPAIHLLMAYVLAGTGNIAGAKEECRRVLELDPGELQAQQLLESLP